METEEQRSLATTMLFLASLLILILLVVGFMKDKAGTGPEWQNVGALAQLTPSAFPCKDLPKLKEALDKYMKGSAPTAACDSQASVDKAEIWVITDRKDYAIQIHSRRTSEMYWVIPEWLTEAKPIQ